VSKEQVGSTPSLTIQIASLSDFDRIHNLRVETLRHHVERIPERFREVEEAPPDRSFIEGLLSDGSGALLLAAVKGVPVGFTTIRLITATPPWVIPELLATVDVLGVTRIWRGRGIGRRLMEAAHEWAREQGATRMYLNVWEANSDALAFYETLGYSVANRNLWHTL